VPAGLNDFLLDPAFAVPVALLAPFAARAVEAWYVLARVKGWVVGGASLLSQSDFPRPNDLTHELLVLAAWLPLAIVVGLIAKLWLGPLLPSAGWPATYFVSALPCAAWWLLRTHRDDQRSLSIRKQRVAEMEIRRTAEFLAHE
jgi:hypothetical protein